jgi:carbon monoxide dehydrogenase subunit G
VVDVTAIFDAEVPDDELFAVVERLDGYPDWLSIVTGVEVDGDAWQVELRGRIGPLARSKRLRMQRTHHDPPHGVRFERRELDGRDHASWVLDATVEPNGSGSRLTMHLHYGGTFGGRVLERMLVDEIEASRPRLRDRLAAGQR